MNYYWTRTEANNAGFFARGAFMAGNRDKGRSLVSKMQKRNPYGNYSIRKAFHSGWKKHKEMKQQ